MAPVFHAVRHQSVHGDPARQRPRTPAPGPSHKHYPPVTGSAAPPRCYPRQMNRAVDRRPLRADAARNVDKIITAARQCFREHGPEVPLQTIAVTAGVGPATLFRNFADKEELVLAALNRQLRLQVDPVIDEALAGLDAAAGLFRVIDAVMAGRQRGSQPAGRRRGPARAADRHHGRPDRIRRRAAGPRPGPGHPAQRHFDDGHDPAAGHADRRRGHHGGRVRTRGAAPWRSLRTPSARNGRTGRCRRRRRCRAPRSAPCSASTAHSSTGPAGAPTARCPALVFGRLFFGFEKVLLKLLFGFPTAAGHFAHFPGGFGPGGNNGSCDLVR